MGVNPHQATKDLEAALCAYCGSPYAVVVTSCTMAILLAVRWFLKDTLGCFVEIPSRTYKGVADSIVHAGGRPIFREQDWTGWYRLDPLPVYDSARYFSSNMYQTVTQYKNEGFVTVSFHASKILADTQGGAILHNSKEADTWLRRARFDGRTEGVHPKDDNFDMIGYHAYVSPDVATRLLWKLSVLPKHIAPLPTSDYSDLSLAEAYK